jgi:hypothetical protein
LPLLLALFPASSNQFAANGVPSDLVNVIKPDAVPAALALLTKTVVLQPSPAAIWGK